MFSSQRRLLLLACLCAGARAIELRSPPLVRRGQLHARLVLPSLQSKSLIGGLLNARQQCEPGESTCEGECCPAGFYCDPPGCCQDGETCNGIVAGCPNSGEVECGFDTCCRVGQSCTSDLECVDGGGGGAGGGGGTAPKPTTTKPVATTKPATTKPATTPAATIEPAPTSSGPTSVPSAPAGSQNVVIDVSTNTDITWEGHWSSGPSSCGSGTAMSVGGTDLITDAYMSYDFTGTAIYVSLASNNAEFGITLDDDEVLYIGDNDSEEPSNCTFGWQRTGLDGGTHNLFIDPLGSKFDPNKIDPPWYFELQNFVIVQSNPAAPQPTTPAAEATTPATPTSQATTLPDEGPGSDQGPGSGPASIGSIGAAHKNSVSWLITAVMIFLGISLL